MSQTAVGCKEFDEIIEVFCGWIGWSAVVELSQFEVGQLDDGHAPSIAAACDTIVPVAARCALQQRRCCVFEACVQLPWRDAGGARG